MERARRESPFRGPIAHGYLTLSLVGSLSIDVGGCPSDAAAGFNYGRQGAVPRFRFQPGRVRLRVVLDVEDRAGDNCAGPDATHRIENNATSPLYLTPSLALIIPAEVGSTACPHMTREPVRLPSIR